MRSILVSGNRRCLLALVVLISVISLHAQAPPTFVSSTFYGGPGDQNGQALAIAGGKIFVVGQTGDFVSYAIPPTTPLASSNLSNGFFLGITATPSRVFPVGMSYPPVCGAADGVGGTEPKTMAAVYDPVTANLLSCLSYNYFPYRGYELYWSAAGDGVSLFATGNAEACGGNPSFILAQIDPSSGALISKVGEPGIDFNGFTCIGGSYSFGLTMLNGNLYAAGTSRLLSEDGVYRPVLMQYTQTLNRNWKARPSDVAGDFLGVNSLNNAIYAVGQSDVGSDTHYLIEKYDQSGNRIWSTRSSGTEQTSLQGITAVGNRLFAAGYTNVHAAGGLDVLLIEIDPATGSVLSSTTFGGAQDDIGNAIATDGTDLYIAGYSRSFPSAAGNQVGQSDIMLLRYKIAPQQQSTTLAFTTASATTSDYQDVAQVQAQLTTTAGGAPVPNEMVTFTLGPSGPTCSAQTDPTGTATCLVTPSQGAGPVTLTVTFAGDALFVGSSASTMFTITKEETVLKFTATSPTQLTDGHPANFAATLKENGTAHISGASVTFTLGSGAKAQSCTGTTDPSGTATCTIVVNQVAGPNTVRANFSGDAFYRPASDTEAVVVNCDPNGQGNYNCQQQGQH